MNCASGGQLNRELNCWWWPCPASAMIAQSSLIASIRSKYNALARSRADTASNSFFFSNSLEVAACEAPVAWEARPGATDWRINWAKLGGVASDKFHKQSLYHVILFVLVSIQRWTLHHTTNVYQKRYISSTANSSACTHSTPVMRERKDDKQSSTSLPVYESDPPFWLPKMHSAADIGTRA